MPTLNYPVSYPPIDDAIVVAADIMSWIYDPADLDASLGMLNGLLDNNNLHTDTEITAELTQRGSFIDMCGASGTANLDYKRYWFGGFDAPSPFVTLSAPDPNLAIAGGGRAYFCKWGHAQVLVMWTIMWTAPNLDDEAKAAIVLTVDGTYEPAMYRDHGKLYDTTPSPEGYKKARVWSGHAVIELTYGWHDIGLEILVDEEVVATRVHAVSIDIVGMKNSRQVIPA